MSDKWKNCSNCKKEIKLNSKYYVCSVSTCQHKRRGLQFCSVSCWSAHVPIMRHRDAWAEERIAPSKVENESENSGETSRRIIVRTPTASSATAGANFDDKNIAKETLVVVSKLKQYIKELSDYNTSGDVTDWLSDHIRGLCIEASFNARADGRKTVMARDFEKINK